MQRPNAVALAILLALFALLPARAADKTLEETYPFKPAPNIIAAPKQEDLNQAMLGLKYGLTTETTAQKRGKALLDFFSICQFGAPSRSVLAWNSSFGKNINLLSVAADISPCAFSSAFSGLIERYFIGVMAINYMDKAINGQPIAMDFTFDFFMMSLGKIGGAVLGPATAVAFFTKAGLDNIAADTVQMIDARMYQDFRTYHLNKHPDADWYIDQVNNQGGPQHLVRTLVQEYMNRTYAEKDADYAGHGMYIMKHAKPDYREAAARKYIRDIVFPLLRKKLADDALDAETDLIIQAQMEAAGFYKREILLRIPNILDRVTRKPPRHVRALLTHGDHLKQLHVVAETTVGPKGIEFRFPPGKLIDPTSKEAKLYLQVWLDAVPPASFMGNSTYEWFKVDLRYQHPRTQQTRDGERLIYTNNTTKRVEMGWPVKVILRGDIPKPPRRARIGAWRVNPPREGLRTISSGAMNSAVVNGNEGLFKELLSGTWKFTVNDRPVGEALIDKPTTLTLNVPAPAALNAPYPGVARPNIEGPLARAKGIMSEELKFERRHDEIIQAAGDAMLGLLTEIMTAQMQAREAHQINFEKRDRVYKEVAGENRKAAFDRLREDAKAISDVEKQLNEMKLRVGKEIMAHDDAIEDATRAKQKTLREMENAARDELKAAEKKAGALETTTTDAMRDVFIELKHGQTAHQGQAAADAQIKALEQRVNALGDQLLQWGQTVDKASAARDRLAGIHQEPIKIEFIGESAVYLRRVNDQAARFDELKQKIEHLKKVSAEPRTRQAMKAVSERHKLRRKNERELTQHLRDAQRALNSLPGWNDGRWQGILRRYGAEFDQHLAAADAAKLRGLAARIRSELGNSRSLAADMLPGKARRETPFSTFDDLANKIDSLLQSKHVFVDMARYQHWADMKTQFEKTNQPRRRTVGALISLAGAAERAAQNAATFQQQTAAADAAVADGFKQIAEGKLDIGGKVDTLATLWGAADKLPAHRGDVVRARVRQTAAQVVGDGRSLIAYAEQAKRPLLVFQNVTTYNAQYQKVGEPRPINSPVCRLTPKTGGYYGINAKVVGRPRGESVNVFIDDGFSPRFEQPNHERVYTLSVPSSGKYNVRLLGGKSKPLTFPFLDQITIQRTDAAWQSPVP